MKITTTVSYEGNPHRLFKFWAMPGEGTDEEDHLRTLLICHKLFFQVADQLNDPYDCFPAIFVNFTPDRARELFGRHIRRENPEMSDADVTAEINRRLDGFDIERMVGDPGFQWGARAAFQEFRKEMAVYCLTARIDSVLMWSHYARNHTGFAVMFDGSDPLIREAQAVRYLTDRPLIDPGAREESTMELVLLVKARDWKYEQEWRITRIKQPGLHDFNSKALMGIIFGMAMSEGDRERLRAMCLEGGLTPKYYQAVDDTRSFNVRIIEA